MLQLIPTNFGIFTAVKPRQAHKLPSTIKRDMTDPVPATNPIDKASLFNDYFYSVFNLKNDQPPPAGCHAIFPVSECLSNITLSEFEILTTLQSLNPSKSPGPDAIPSRLLKELAPDISSSITCIFNKSLSEGSFSNVIYLDMAKAFDKVPHEKLLYKLEMVGVRGQLLAWFRSYLTNRRRRTVIEGHASDWRYVPSGVHQGSIIGPLPFLIFINNIAVNIDADTNIHLYADDAKCFRGLLSLDDQDALQRDLYSIEDWSDLWAIKLANSEVLLSHFGAGSVMVGSTSLISLGTIGLT
ncbi:RNA-directed DNA polymerase from mobile element jockey [Stylophora pistillata]|uniref:RNA-directed DNA polymerase from mobile element jockey n=1 Tax=Stylophora pistillata TaxID=50429 RepID=A0A2B4S3J0_STYPI|nr:RNA-directed DNA polymerase from mobile element jockey [Stylophora pistillata]